jgi:hypothetical protein
VIGKEVPIDPEKAAGRSKAQQIRDLTDYQRAADEAAKVMYFTTRGFQSQTFAGQQLEMIALAMESVRSVQPVKHYIFSFKEGECLRLSRSRNCSTSWRSNMGAQGTR